MIHSGSRNLGLKIEKEYHAKAVKLNKLWYSDVPEELSFLPIQMNEGKEYKAAMEFALEYAKENRFGMMRLVSRAIREYIPMVQFEEMLNIHHNYASYENHYGENVIVHRKGATSAKLNQLGIIPGSQGTKSYIVKGKGNKESFESCSHGAGRKMSRTKAKELLNLDEEIKKLNDQGIVHGIRSIKELDEASGAYKDINDVMNNQKDLIEIVTELSPIGVIKG